MEARHDDAALPDFRSAAIGDYSVQVGTLLPAVPAALAVAPRPLGPNLPLIIIVHAHTPPNLVDTAWSWRRQGNRCTRPPHPPTPNQSSLSPSPLALLRYATSPPAEVRSSSASVASRTGVTSGSAPRPQLAHCLTDHLMACMGLYELRSTLRTSTGSRLDPRSALHARRQTPGPARSVDQDRNNKQRLRRRQQPPRPSSSTTNNQQQPCQSPRIALLTAQPSQRAV